MARVFQIVALERFFRRACVLFFVLLFGTMYPASAKDLDVLIRITYAAFRAEQGSAMCNLPRLPLSDDDRRIFSNARSYGAWIKQQINTGLSDDEVRYVLRSAADKAVGEMREVVRSIKSNPLELQSAELLRWCTGTMKGIADEVVGTYIRQPDLIEQLIKKAKED